MFNSNIQKCLGEGGPFSTHDPPNIGLNIPMYYYFNTRITSWFFPTSFHSHSLWQADYMSSQIMVIFHVYILIKIWGLPHILIKYKFVTSHKYEVNLILLSRHCLVNNIRFSFMNIRWCPCSILLPQTDIANYGAFCLANTLFYNLTFHITGLHNFWRKNNLKFLGGTPPSGPLKI